MYKASPLHLIPAKLRCQAEMYSMTPHPVTAQQMINQMHVKVLAKSSMLNLRTSMEEIHQSYLAIDVERSM